MFKYFSTYKNLKLISYSHVTGSFIQFSGNSSYIQFLMRSAGDLGQRVYMKFHVYIHLFYFEIPEFLRYLMLGEHPRACRGEDAWVAYLETVVMIYFQQREAPAR